MSQFNGFKDAYLAITVSQYLAVYRKENQEPQLHHAKRILDDATFFLERVEELNRLVNNYLTAAKDDKSSIREDIRDCGEHLAEIGGLDLMVFVAEHLMTHKDAGVYLNKLWDGIGDWLA